MNPPTPSVEPDPELVAWNEKQAYHGHNMALDEHYPTEYEWGALWHALREDGYLQRNLGNLRLMLATLRTEYSLLAAKAARADELEAERQQYMNAIAYTRAVLRDLMESIETGEGRSEAYKAAASALSPYTAALAPPTPRTKGEGEG